MFFAISAAVLPWRGVLEFVEAYFCRGCRHLKNPVKGSSWLLHSDAMFNAVASQQGGCRCDSGPASDLYVVSMFFLRLFVFSPGSPTSSHRWACAYQWLFALMWSWGEIVTCPVWSCLYIMTAKRAFNRPHVTLIAGRKQLSKMNGEMFHFGKAVKSGCWTLSVFFLSRLCL